MGVDKKKVCIATTEFPPEQWGGLARTAGRVAQYVRDMGLEVHVAQFSVDASSPVLLDENRETLSADGIVVHRVRVGKDRSLDFPREIWDCPHNLTIQMMYQSLEMLHHDVEFDLLHSFFLYPVGFVAGMLARRMSVPSMVTIVGNDVKRYIFSPEKAAVCRSGLENADRVIAMSRDLVEMAHALTPIAEKASIIYNSVEVPEDAWCPSRDSSRPFRLGCAGIFKYAKGLPYLFKAVAELGSQAPVLLELRGVVRESEKETFHHLVQRTRIEGILKMEEPLPHSRIPGWLRSLDLFVLPSLTEGCPNILMEAMAAGVPSVATLTGAAEDLIDNGVSGLLVPWGDSKALARALAKIMANESLAESLGAAARSKMKEFSAERERDCWEAVYRELLDF